MTTTINICTVVGIKRTRLAYDDQYARGVVVCGEGEVGRLVSWLVDCLHACATFCFARFALLVLLALLCLLGLLF